MKEPIEFAVVDVETTGVVPERNDRIIEIAIVRIDERGRKINEYCSLVNPDRDIGATRIHGISAGDLRKAPSFAEIAGDVVDKIACAVFVAHNVHFDWRFLKSELARLSTSLPDAPLLCTMSVARRIDPAIPSRRLDSICAHFSLPEYMSHSALDDANAAAQVLIHFLQESRSTRIPLEMDDIFERCRGLSRKHWPDLPVSGKAYQRKDSACDRAREETYLSELVSLLPSATDVTAEIEEYFGYLDRVLADRRVTIEEAEFLLAHAESAGLVREQVFHAHNLYLQSLVREANADNKISAAERRDLDLVRRLLGVSQEDFQTMLRSKPPGETKPPPQHRNFQEVAGKSVCFTGELNGVLNGEPITRSRAEKLAQEHGMIVKASVTKSLDFLVVADPDSMSSKAKKARDYGVLILAELVFWNMLGTKLD